MSSVDPASPSGRTSFATRRPRATFETAPGQPGRNGVDGVMPLKDLAAFPELLLTEITEVDAATLKPLAGTGVWPDGAVATYEAVADSFGIASYVVTHADGADIRTFTQPTVTRDGDGVVTDRPEITES